MKLSAVAVKLIYRNLRSNLLRKFILFVFNVFAAICCKIINLSKVLPVFAEI
jgi:hypothetical protein